MTAAPALFQNHESPTVPRLSVIEGGLTHVSKTPKQELQQDIERLLPELQRRARYLTKSSEIALDLVQDTIERAFKFAHSYETGTNLRAWLFQVMYSVFASQCRRAQRHRAAIERLGNDPFAWGASTSAATHYPALSQAIEAGLSDLPPHFAQVVWLVDVQDFSYREAAEYTGSPIGTVMSRLHRARRLLRERLGEVA